VIPGHWSSVCEKAGACYGLDLKGTLKINVQKVWSPACGATVCGGEPLGGGAWWEEVRSLEV
jgi:hypothetical protein